ncbi:MAG TPA: hypothetical protein VLR90_01870 [Blastocatellia bacterium]|nr:hypothetical protein [Blastocatellia bacterium]
MKVDYMSTKKVDKKSRQHWQAAIDYGERLLEATKGVKRRARLSDAIEWFKHRLKEGAKYPGLPLTEDEQREYALLQNTPNRATNNADNTRGLRCMLKLDCGFSNTA